MTQDEFDPDPEVLADLRLRAASLRDRSRTRGAGVYDWKPEPDIGMWRCRSLSCRALFGVTATAMDHMAQCNEWLRARGEQPLGVEEIGFCDQCRAEAKRTAPDRNRRQVARLAIKIRELKESRDPAGQRDVILQLREWGHPDVDGLVSVLQERNNNKTKRAL